MAVEVAPWLAPSLVLPLGVGVAPWLALLLALESLRIRLSRPSHSHTPPSTRNANQPRRSCRTLWCSCRTRECRHRMDGEWACESVRSMAQRSESG